MLDNSSVTPKSSSMTDYWHACLLEKIDAAKLHLKGHYFSATLKDYAEAVYNAGKVKSGICAAQYKDYPGIKALEDLTNYLCDLLSGRKKLYKDDIDGKLEESRKKQGVDIRPKSKIEVVSEKDFSKMDVRRPG